MFHSLKSLIRNNTLLLITFGFFFLIMLTGIKGTNEKVESVIDVVLIQESSPLGFVGTPFEFSRARTQFLQVISLYQRNSFILTYDEATVTIPDAGYYNEIFRSLAPPGLSIFMYPFFFVGNLVGLGQLLSYIALAGIYGLSILFFFLFLQRTFLSKEVASIGALIYGFATPGIMYSSTPMYHSFSLLGITLLSYWTLKIYDNPEKSRRLFIYTSFFVGLSVFVEYAHPLMFLPFYISQALILRKSDIKNPSRFTRFFLISLIIPAMSITGLLAMQQAFFGNMFQMTNTQVQYTGKSILDLPEETLIQDTAYKNNLSEFVETKYIPRNINLMFFRENHGFFNTSPLLIFGIIGFPLLYFTRKIFKRSFLPLILSGLVAILIYTSFAGGGGDYSAGMRYLIPMTPLLVALMALVISKIRWNIYFIALTLPLLFWSFLSHLSGFYTTIFSDHSDLAHKFGIMQWDYLLSETTSSYWFSYIYSTLPLVYYPIIASFFLTLFCAFLLKKIQSHQENI